MNPRYLPAIALLSAATAVSTLFSCTDEMDAQFDKISNATGTGCDDGIIRFIDSEWRDTDPEVVSRSGNEDENAGLKHKMTIPMDGCENGDTLFLKIYEQESADAKESRGKMLKTGGIWTSMSVIGFKFGADEEWSEEYTPDFMYNVKYSWCEDPALGKKNYNTPDAPLWPGANYNLKFFSISPSTHYGTLSPASYCGSPKFTYDVPVLLDDQKDLLAGETGVLNGKPSSAEATMKFEHILSTIQFRESKEFINGRVRRITLKGLRQSGTYDYGSKTWEVKDEVTNYSRDINTYFNGVENEAIMDSTNCFLLIPQTIPEGASIEVEYSPWLATTIYTLKAPLSGTLEKGKTYIFKLSTTSIDVTMNFGFTVPANFKMNTVFPTALTEMKLSNCYTITHKEEDKENRENVGTTWQMKWYDYNPETGLYDKPLSGFPNWIGGWGYSSNSIRMSTSTSLQSSDYNERYKYYLVANDKLFENIGALHDDELKRKESRGSSSSPWNLSNLNGLSENQNTANSYIVNAPGTYSIPLVYGNALKNGSYNNDLYNGDITTATNMLAPYPLAGRMGTSGYELVQVKKPYIYDYAPEGVDAITYITKAELIWQDAKNLISSVSLSDDHKSIVFTINKNNIQQGNALIGVKSGEDYLWAWHIWITHYEPGVGDKTITTPLGEKFTFMPYNLGWVDATKKYPGGKARMVFSLPNYPQYSTEVVVNMEPQIRVDGYMPYWMEQSPFAARSSRQHYNISGSTVSVKSGNLIQSSATATEKLKSILRNPGVSNTTGYDIPYINFWSWKQTASNNDKYKTHKVVKSLYDPCPYGYCMPSGGIFYGFSENYANSDDYYPQNEDSGKYGMVTLYCDPVNKSETIEFPFSGYCEGASLKYDYSYIGIAYNELSNKFIKTCNPVVFSNDKLKYYSISGVPYHIPVRPVREQ